MVLILESEGRVPPQAVETEEAILGEMLVLRESMEVGVNLLSPSDFYKPAHRHIFDGISALYDSGKPTDVLALEGYMRDQGLLDVAGGSIYLYDLTRNSANGNIEYHAQILKEKALKRQIILESTNAIKEAYDTTTDAYDVYDQINLKISSLLSESTLEKKSFT